MSVGFESKVIRRLNDKDFMNMFEGIINTITHNEQIIAQCNDLVQFTFQFKFDRDQSI